MSVASRESLGGTLFNHTTWWCYWMWFWAAAAAAALNHICDRLSFPVFPALFPSAVAINETTHMRVCMLLKKEWPFIARLIPGVDIFYAQKQRWTRLFLDQNHNSSYIITNVCILAWFHATCWLRHINNWAFWKVYKLCTLNAES